jgi:hypothetical protein
MPTPMMGPHFANPALPVPANPPLHGAVMDSHDFRYLGHAPAPAQ